MGRFMCARYSSSVYAFEVVLPSFISQSRSIQTLRDLPKNPEPGWSCKNRLYVSSNTPNPKTPATQTPFVGPQGKMKSRTTHRNVRRFAESQRKSSKPSYEPLIPPWTQASCLQFCGIVLPENYTVNPSPLYQTRELVVAYIQHSLGEKHVRLDDLRVLLLELCDLHHATLPHRIAISPLSVKSCRLCPRHS